MTVAASIDDYFEGKTQSLETFRVIADQIAALGRCDIEVASQISFGVRRKFAWFWLYNVTKKNPDGVPHLMLALNREVRSANVRNIEQVSYESMEPPDCDPHEGRRRERMVTRTLGDRVRIRLCLDASTCGFRHWLDSPDP